MNSPFQFGKTVTGKAFTDRTEQMKYLSNNLSSGISTIIISPRRWGKSSLVRKCMEDTFRPKDDYQVIMIDLFRVRSEEEFLQAYARETIKSTSGKIEEAVGIVKSVFTSLVPRISFTADSVNDLSLSFDIKELKKNRAEILDLPERIARKKKMKIILCVDEFQNMRSYKNAELLKKELRSTWQHHEHVTYCLYGSKRHMMSDIFNNAESPLYRFGSIIFLEKIEKKYWISFIFRAFADTGKRISEDLCADIADSMRNHPFYVQQLSHIVWNLTEKKVHAEILSSAKNLIVDMNRPFFMREYESLSNSQVHLLKAICSGERHLNSEEVLHEYKLGTSANVSKNKRVLEEQDIIDISSGTVSFIDPVFELWFREEILRDSSPE